MIELNLKSINATELLEHLVKFEVIYQNQGNSYEIASLIDEFIENNPSNDKVQNNLLLVKAFYLEMGRYYEQAFKIYYELTNYIACARVLRALGRIKEALRFEKKDASKKTRNIKEWCI